MHCCFGATCEITNKCAMCFRLMRWSLHSMQQQKRHFILLSSAENRTTVLAGGSCCIIEQAVPFSVVALCCIQWVAMVNSMITKHFLDKTLYKHIVFFIHW